MKDPPIPKERGLGEGERWKKHSEGIKSIESPSEENMAFGSGRPFVFEQYRCYMEVVELPSSIT